MESVFPKKRDIPKNFLDGVVGDNKRQVENECVEEVVSSGSIDHDLRVALEVRLSWHFRDFPFSLPLISESMGPSTCLPRFLFMIAPLKFSCPIGRTRSSTNQRTTRNWLSPCGLTSWPLSISPSNPAHGHKASFGVPVHHFATQIDSTTAMISFQRSDLPVRIRCSYPHRALCSSSSRSQAKEASTP